MITCDRRTQNTAGAKLADPVLYLSTMLANSPDLTYAKACGVMFRRYKIRFWIEPFKV